MIRFMQDSPDQLNLGSALAMVEVRSAISRKHVAGELTFTHWETAIAILEGELRRMVLQPVTQTSLSLANRTVDIYKLRALDAVQLASALLFQQDLVADDDIVFCFIRPKTSPGSKARIICDLEP